MIQNFEKFLPDSIIQSVSNDIERRGWKYGWRSNPSAGYAHWNNDFANVMTENGLDVADKLSAPYSTAWAYIKENHFPEYSLIRCYSNAHTYGIEGYPHTDSKRKEDLTLIVYLNKRWERNWGGETLIYKGNQIEHAEMPVYNNALVFPGNAWHVARGVTRICPALRLTLMFKISSGQDLLRNTIQTFLVEIGARKVNHKTTSLAGHLLSTYDLLRLAGRDDDTCSAGAIHSVFGTNAFTQKMLTEDEQSRTIAIVGERATRLALLFSKIKRPSTLEVSLGKTTALLDLIDGGTVEVNQQDLESLCAIECANLHDQQELTKFHSLNFFWCGIYKE
jgi:hypothetical protein